MKTTLALLLAGGSLLAATHGKVATKAYHPPSALEVACSQRAEELVLSVAGTDFRKEGKAVLPPLAIKEAKFKSGKTWAGAPANGMLNYFVAVKSADGYECDYDVTLRAMESEKTCGLEDIKFKMCAK